MKTTMILVAYIALAVSGAAQKKKEVFSEENYGGNNNGTIPVLAEVLILT